MERLRNRCVMSSCLHPIFAYDYGKTTANGKRALSFKAPLLGDASAVPFIPLPCGKCAVCLSSRRKEWISRMLFENYSSPASTFVTLTYRDECLPPSFDKLQVQRFIKRFRQAPRDFGVPPFSLRYFLVGEYGSKTHRPHYHAIFFGVDLLTEPWLPYAVGFDVSFRPRYASRVLESLWPYGFNVVGSVTHASIRYVSKYVSKSFESSADKFILKSQGLGRAPFVDVSRVKRKVIYSPRDLLFDSFSDGFAVLPSDSGFSRVSLPRVLDDYIERFRPSLLASVKTKRQEFSIHFHDERSPVSRARPIIHSLADEMKKGVLDNE